MVMIVVFRWLPNGDDLQKTIDSMVNNAYIYGRGWISDKVNVCI